MNRIVIGINAVRATSGGAINHIENILQHARFDKDKIKHVHVWLNQKHNYNLPEASWLSVHYPKTFFGSFGRLLWEGIFLFFEFKSKGCNILFNVDASSLFLSKKTVTLSQDLLSFEEDELKNIPFGFSRLRQEILKRLQINSLKRSTTSIFLTKYASKLVSKYTGALNNVEIIPHGINQDKSIVINKKKLSKNDDIKCIYISPIWRFKHQWNVVEAVHKLRKQGYQLSLTCIGSSQPDAYSKFKRALTRYDKKNEYVNYLGHIPPEMIQGNIKESDIFIFASSCENLPITLLEGMASGLPIACSDSGPMPEILKNGGLFFNPFNPDDIAYAIKKIIDDEQINEHICTEAKKEIKNFDWQAVSNKTFECIINTYQR